MCVDVRIALGSYPGAARPRETLKFRKLLLRSGQPGDANVAIAGRDLAKSLAVVEQLRRQGRSGNPKVRAYGFASDEESLQARIKRVHTRNNEGYFPLAQEGPDAGRPLGLAGRVK